MAVEIAGRRNSNDIATNTKVELNTSTFTTIASASENRIFFYVANTDATNTVIINLRTSGTAVDETGICLPPGTYWQMPTNNIYTGEISGITTTGTFNVMVCEY